MVKPSVKSVGEILVGIGILAVATAVDYAVLSQIYHPTSNAQRLILVGLIVSVIIVGLLVAGRVLLMSAGNTTDSDVRPHKP